VLEYARKNNITKVVIGKPLKPRWQEILTGSIGRTNFASGDVDVYVISARLELQKRWCRSIGSLIARRTVPAQFWLVALPPFLTFRARQPGTTNLVMLYLVSVLISAIYLGRGPSSWRDR